ncbi:prolyl oligopeptidase family serine peptidase [Spirosoma aureum]|uniref:Prolyl oligopeptidase family serine peptidase n=1 Tax=Spirosoma aureum TaxID=2692134 RepID=A0A6G9ANF2_9BACT|nr:alpha/beta fold hydrolase [Spirosoma aureum]QIP13866.1 prolyl oligopeptidase family serine peptidase [Spirosoma aureum]
MLLFALTYLRQLQNVLTDLKKIACQGHCATIFLLVMTMSAGAQSNPAALWNLRTLFQTPTMRWLNSDTSRIRSLVYRGETYGSIAKTDVFAYYATPGSLAGKPELDQHLPGVILVHGGGGKAFAEWAELWARRGYAALAMDLSGRGFDGKRLPNGGPDQDSLHKFSSIDSTGDKQWVYHAVANVIRAHSLLRSLPGVDSGRTAITGISWGGFLTCIVVGLDPRFTAAVPVYGCGFIEQPGGFFYEKEFGTLTTDQKKRWTARYDPQHFVGKAHLPMLWVNGTNDMFYPPNIFSRTYSLVKSPKNYSITTTLKHGHIEGWTPPEIGWFVDSYLTHGTPLPVLSVIGRRSGRVQAVVSGSSPIKLATLSFTTDSTLPYRERYWQTRPANVSGNRIIADAPPAQTTIWLLNVTDERGATVSSAYQFER